MDLGVLITCNQILGSSSWSQLPYSLNPSFELLRPLFGLQFSFLLTLAPPMCLWFACPPQLTEFLWGASAATMSFSYLYRVIWYFLAMQISLVFSVSPSIHRIHVSTVHLSSYHLMCSFHIISKCSYPRQPMVDSRVELVVTAGDLEAVAVE